MSSIQLACLGTGFTFLMTAIGASVVFFFRKEINGVVQQVFLGFAAGVMIAASVWSLLMPAIDMAQQQGTVAWVPAAIGFLLGAALLLGMDRVMPHLHMKIMGDKTGERSLKRSTLLVLAVTLHNLPEGMAVGLACALAAQGEANGVTVAGAAALALGIGLQNFPEGAAISLPLRKEGASSLKSFTYGALSGIVEPIGGVIAVLLAGSVTVLMPWLLSFAAGAMIYVVVKELIPEATANEKANAGTWGVLIGFVIMMVMDVALG